MKRKSFFGLSNVLTFPLLAVLFMSSIIVTSCQKKSSDDDDDGTPTVHADLTGTYIGVITTSEGVDSLAFDVVKTGDRTFEASSFGSPIAQLKVTGNSFSGSPLASGDFKTLNGTLDGNTMSFNGIDNDNEPFSFTGTRTSGSGGGGGGGSTSITIDGTKYDLINAQPCSGGAINCTYQDPNNQFSVASITVTFENDVKAGTFQVKEPFNFPADEASNTVNVAVSIGGFPTNGSSGSLTVTASGSGFSADINGITFDTDFSGQPTTEVTVSGTAICE